MANVLVFGDKRLSIADVMALARRQKSAELSQSAAWRGRIEQTRQFLEQQWQNQKKIYGVTTGYGNSCDVDVPQDLVDALPLNLVRFHGCGLGQPLSREASRAVIAVRLASLSTGYSGVRLKVLEMLCALLHHDILPVIPEEGSVGASGDLTPLSYLAAVMMGEREVFFQDERQSAAKALAKVGLEPLALQPKEALSLMNGTSVMTALACLAFERADYLSRLTCRLTSFAAAALQSKREHFDARLHAAKPHPGQVTAARRIETDLARDPAASGSKAQSMQSRYSIRCAPQVIGVLDDALVWMQQAIETEINSANDNPLIDIEHERILHGGHFYGGHIAFAMDGLKLAVAHLADLLDRQLLLLVDPTTNQGLPNNLSGASGAEQAVHHGFKAVQIATSAWTAEALKLTLPAGIFSRSTESHNQDKVSMGTIAARDALRVLELTEQVAAAHLLAVTQALALRDASGAGGSQVLAPEARAMLAKIREDFSLVTKDRALDGELRQTLEKIRAQTWKLSA